MNQFSDTDLLHFFKISWLEPNGEAQKKKKKNAFM